MQTPPAHTALLVRRAADGDAQAFEALVDPVSGRLLLFLRRRGGGLLGTDAAAEDLLQTVLLTAWTKLADFEDRGPGSFYAWLLAIARHALSDRLKYLQAKGRGEVGQLGSRVGAAYDPGTSITKLVQRRDDFARACAALEALEPTQREVVELHLLEDRSLSEIARALGVTKNAVWERLRRGMSRLRAALEARA